VEIYPIFSVEQRNNGEKTTKVKMPRCDGATMLRRQDATM